MSNYSNNPADVRVDFFKPRDDGWKWQSTEVMTMSGLFHSDDIHAAIRHALDVQFSDSYAGMMAVVLEPCHVHAHPIAVLKEPVPGAGTSGRTGTSDP